MNIRDEIDKNEAALEQMMQEKANECGASLRDFTAILLSLAIEKSKSDDTHTEILIAHAACAWLSHLVTTLAVENDGE